MKILGGSRINGVWRKRYESDKGFIEVITDSSGNKIIKKYMVKS